MRLQMFQKTWLYRIMRGGLRSVNSHGIMIPSGALP